MSLVLRGCTEITCQEINYEATSMRMTPLDFQSLRHDYPNIFGGGAFISLWVGTGWTSIVRPLCEGLEVVARQPLAEGHAPLRVVQIKEADGVLACLLEGATEEALALKAEAEHRSETICEACGQPGSLVSISGWNTTWYKTLCDLHHAEAQTEERQ